MNLLFICSKNQWRSPTGEAIYARTNGLNVRSAGTASSARRRVTVGDIQWADLILVMEPKHKQRLQADFAKPMQHKTVHVLDIPDVYPFMDDELVDVIRTAVDPLVESQ